jgi:hypothetical protein
MVSFTSQPFNFQRKGSQHLMNGRLGELQIWSECFAKEKYISSFCLEWTMTPSSSSP